MENSYDYLLKIVLIGDSGVGKAQVQRRFLSDDEVLHTIGVDFGMKTIELAGKKIKLQVWDTAGQQGFPTIAMPYYRGAMGFMVMYDVTKDQSFINLSHWMRHIQKLTEGNRACQQLVAADGFDSTQRPSVARAEEIWSESHPVVPCGTVASLLGTA